MFGEKKNPAFSDKHAGQSSVEEKRPISCKLRELIQDNSRKQMTAQKYPQQNVGEKREPTCLDFE